MDADPPLDATIPESLDAKAAAALQAALGPDFDIRRRLGEGSMATVWLARETALARLVAIKVLLPGKATDETARRRFEREAKASASLGHPNVVPVYRFGRLPDETPYLVMRFVKGRTMAERLIGEGTLPIDLTRTVLIEVASALSAAHAQGIVHRDVRPANVLWDEEKEEALLSDFGIAAILTSGGEPITRLTKTGQMLGDPRYLSPEQLLDKDLTERADVYAFGVMGYELLTGLGPYAAKTNTEWITAHLTKDPEDLRAMRPEVPEDMAELLRRCLNREPNHRPTAANIVRELQGTGQVPSAAPSGSVEDIADLEQLIKRRVPQIVVVTAVGGWAMVEVVETLFMRESLVFALTLPFVGCGVLAATVVAWFHGERGKQRTNVLEWILLSVIVVAWVMISAWVVMIRP